MLDVMTSSNCPVPETLAAFADGRLKGEERLRVIRHLNECEDCYELVVEAARYCEEIEEEVGVSGPGSAWPGATARAVGLAALSAAAVLVVGLALGWFDAFLAPPTIDTAWAESRQSLSPDDPLVRRASQVFERVSGAAAPGQDYRLVVLSGAGFNLAFSGSNGTVFITEAAVRDVLGQDDEAGQSRLALVFGHEISHLMKGEEWHAFAAYSGLEKKLSEPRIVRLLERRFPQLKETRMRADRDGLFYAFQAGFDVSRMVWEERRQLEAGEPDDGLFVLMSRNPVGVAAFPSQLTLEERVGALTQSLSAISDQLEVLHAANRLYQAGRYEDAEGLLVGLSDNLPLPEVFNNLAVVRFQQAARALADCNKDLARRYYLPVVVDYRSIRRGTDILGSEVDGCFAKDDFRNPVEAAEEALQAALDRDPHHLSAWNNRMSLALLDEKETNPALAQRYRNLESRPARAETRLAGTMLACLLELRLAIDLNDLQNTNIRLNELRGLWQDHPDFAPLAYNLASILNRARQDFEQPSWEREADGYLGAFLQLESRGVYAQRAREQLGLPVGSGSPASGLTLPDPPLPLGHVAGSNRSRLGAMNALTIARPNQESPLTLYRDPLLRALEEGSALLWVERSAREILDEGAVRARYGQPLETVSTSAGSFLRYSDGFGADIVDGRLKALVWFRAE